MHFAVHCGATSFRTGSYIVESHCQFIKLQWFYFLLFLCCCITHKVTPWSRGFPCPKFSLVSHKNMNPPPRKISSTYLLWRLRIFKAFRESYFIERRKRAHSWRTIAFLDGAMTAWANLPISHAALKVSRNSINGEESHKMCQPVENLSLQINAVLPINTFSCT